jgi:TolA-binding protein
MASEVLRRIAARYPDTEAARAAARLLAARPRAPS